MTLRSQISKIIDQPVVSLESFGGCEPSVFYKVVLKDGTELGCKCSPRARTEAQMLQAIDSYGQAARVVAQGDEFFLHSFIHKETASGLNWRHLGSSVRALHDRTGDRFGWEEDYAFDTVSILNPQKDDWVDFWRNSRLMPFHNDLPIELGNRLETLCLQLHSVIPAKPKASLLHGDLWAGNIVFSHGESYLIDPACFYGHAEVDLAMLHLFDDPHPAFWEGYGPVDDGFDERMPVYQLWPALVHRKLFGDGYIRMIDRLLTELGV